MPQAPRYDQTRTMEVCGHPLRVRDAGPRDRHALLIFNGSAANLLVLDPLINILAQHRRVIAFDQPGMGRTPSVYPTLSVPTLARLGAQCAQTLGVTTLDVLGYSFGGAMAQQMALTRPDLVRRVVLVAAVYGAGGIPSDPYSSLTVLAHQTPAQQFCRDEARRAYGGVVARDDEALTAYERAIDAAPPDPLSILGQAIAASTWTGLPWLWAIRQPTLVLSGDEDRVVPIYNARLIASMLPKARLDIVPRAGHLLLMDQAADVAERIEGFLAPGAAEPSRAPRAKSSTSSRAAGARAAVTDLRRYRARAASVPEQAKSS